MSATSLFEVRRAVGDLVTMDLPDGLSVLWDAPKQAEDTEALRVCYWVDPTEIDVTPYTLPNGRHESYVATLTLQSLPVDGDVSPEDAAASVEELLEVVAAVVTANPHPVDAVSSGWDVSIDLAGYSYVSGRLEMPAGWAAGFDVRIQVEATRCTS